MKSIKNLEHLNFFLQSLCYSPIILPNNIKIQVDLEEEDFYNLQKEMSGDKFTTTSFEYNGPDSITCIINKI